VSTEERRDGFLTHFAVWGSLGASLYLMPFGSLLAPALSIEQAVLAAVIAALVAALLVAAVAALAARTGHSTLDLVSGPLGERSRLPIGALLLARHVLVASFALILMTDAATLIGERALGSDLRPVWAVLLGAGALGLALLGRERLSLVMRRGGIWIMLLLGVVIAASAYMEFEIPSYLRRPAVGGWPTVWQAVDVMLIFPLLWLPVVADFARSSGDARAAARGTFTGMFLFSAWFGTLGVIYLPAVESGDIAGFLVGMELSLGALVILFLLQSDELHLNLLSSKTVLEAAPGASVPAIGAALPLLAAIPAAIVFGAADVEQYVFLMASVFVPAFGVVLADALIPGRRAPVLSVLAWAAGFVLYQWISPAEIGWWQDAFEEPFAGFRLAFPLGAEADWLGAAIPSFLLAFGIQAVCGAVAMVGGAVKAPREATG
jgi:purine-cytosine permease-like protein